MRLLLLKFEWMIDSWTAKGRQHGRERPGARGIRARYSLFTSTSVVDFVSCGATLQLGYRRRNHNPATYCDRREVAVKGPRPRRVLLVDLAELPPHICIAKEGRRGRELHRPRERFRDGRHSHAEVLL